MLSRWLLQTDRARWSLADATHVPDRFVVVFMRGIVIGVRFTVGSVVVPWLATGSSRTFAGLLAPGLIDLVLRRERVLALGFLCLTLRRTSNALLSSALTVFLNDVNNDFEIVGHRSVARPSFGR